ncbi:hypothetical protein JCM3774_006162 [Rhodotorula dairenensis]
MMSQALDAPLDAQLSYRRRTRSSATSAEVDHVCLLSYSRPGKRVRGNPSKASSIAAEDTESPLLPPKVESAAASPSRVSPKRRRRAKGDYADLGSDPLTDRICEGLDVLFCGENPGIRTAETQLHYASPHNHFYKAVHAAGLTPSVLEPSASRTFPEDYNIGITNLIPRPTREASELTKLELEAAVPLFLQKVILHRPRIVAFIGMGVGATVAQFFARLPGATDFSATPPSSAAFPAESKAKKAPPVKAAIGLQPFALAHTAAGHAGPVTYFYVLPSTSGRVAAYPLPVKLALFRTFGNEVAKLRLAPSARLALPESARFFSAGDLGIEVAPVSEMEGTVCKTAVAAVAEDANVKTVAL